MNADFSVPWKWVLSTGTYVGKIFWICSSSTPQILSPTCRKEDFPRRWDSTEACSFHTGDGARLQEWCTVRCSVPLVLHFLGTSGFPLTTAAFSANICSPYLRVTFCFLSSSKACSIYLISFAHLNGIRNITNQRAYHCLKNLKQITETRAGRDVTIPFSSFWIQITLRWWLLSSVM